MSLLRLTLIGSLVFVASSAHVVKANKTRPTQPDRLRQLGKRAGALRTQMSAALRQQVAATLERSTRDLAAGKQFKHGWYVGRESGFKGEWASSHSGTLLDGSRRTLVQTRNSPRRGLRETFIRMTKGNSSIPAWDVVSRSTTADKLEVRTFKALPNGKSLEVITTFSGFVKTPVMKVRKNQRERYQIRDKTGRLINRGTFTYGANGRSMGLGRLAQKLGMRERFVQDLIEAVPVGAPLGLLHNH